MKSATILVALLVVASAPAFTQPSISSLVNAASLDGVISPGCLVTITGTGLADTVASAPDGSSAISLAGVTVTVSGIPS